MLKSLLTRIKTINVNYRVLRECTVTTTKDDLITPEEARKRVQRNMEIAAALNSTTIM